jgi:CarD family transcriptional regulator
MRTGSIYDVVEVLKSLTFLARSKNLSFREKRMLDRAKFLLISEIAEVEGKTQTAIEERVEKALAKTFEPDAAKGSIQKPVGVRAVKSDA